MRPPPGIPISDRFRGRDNALNLIRLLLAFLVIVSHSWPIGGFGEDPSIGGLSLGGYAVGGFFAISGFLISASAATLSPVAFGWRRFLRIFPGYWACLLVTAFVLAPATAVAGWSASDATHYAVANAPMVLSLTNEIGTTLSSVPLPSWNGSLWTLRYELFCYVSAGAVAALPLGKHRRWVVALLFVTTTAASLGPTGTGAVHDLLGLMPFFFAGAVLQAFSTRIPLSGVLAGVSAVALGVVAALGPPSLVPLPLAYLTVWVSVVAPKQLRRMASRNDLSYGVYLYGFPVAQCLLLLGARALGPAVLAALTAVAVVPFAAASWFVVERPALRLKGLLQPRDRTIFGLFTGVTRRSVRANSRGTHRSSSIPSRTLSREGQECREQNRR